MFAESWENSWKLTCRHFWFTVQSAVGFKQFAKKEAQSKLSAIFIWERHFGKKMKICLVLLASLVAVAFGHNKDGASYAAKKAAKLSFKVSLSLLIESLQ